MLTMRKSMFALPTVALAANAGAAAAPEPSDLDITTAVSSDLFASHRMDADDITAMVDDGVLTLEGTVDSLGENEAARENAGEGGAKRVRSNLTLDI